MKQTQSESSAHVHPGDGHQRLSFIRQYLDPTESLTEVLFGLIMVLAFTLGAGLIVKEGDAATTQMLLGILGCNVAWGIIDGAMYVMGCMYDRSRKARLLRSIRNAGSEGAALALVAQALDDRLEPLTSPAERNQLYHAILMRLKNVPLERTHLEKDDILGALATFWLVFISTIPAVLPFLIFRDRFVALRVSNLLLLIMLFWVGFHWARATSSNPWRFGSTLLLAGLIMVAIVMALGG